LDEVRSSGCGPRTERRAVALPADAGIDRAVDRDAVPGELTIGSNEVPEIRAQPGRGFRCGRLSLHRHVGGPRIRRPGAADEREKDRRRTSDLWHEKAPARVKHLGAFLPAGTLN
jgi:hypothetical protein